MTRRNFAATALALCSVVLSGCAVSYPADPAATSDSTYEVVIEPTAVPEPTPSTPAPTSAAPVEAPAVTATAAIDLLDIPYEVETLRLPVDTPVTVTAGGEVIYAEDSTVRVSGSGTTELVLTLDQETADQGYGYVFISTSGGTSRALNLEAFE